MRRYTAHRCRIKARGRERFTDDDTPYGHVHYCDTAGCVTDCGKEIPHDGTWYVDPNLGLRQVVTCPKCKLHEPKQRLRGQKHIDNGMDKCKG